MYLKDGKLSDNEELAKKVVAEAPLYTVVNDILYYLGTKSKIPRAECLQLFFNKLWQIIIKKVLLHTSQDPAFTRHLVKNNMYRDTQRYAQNCPQWMGLEGS